MKAALELGRWVSGRLPSTTPKQRAHPDFPLRAFVRGGPVVEASPAGWAKGRSDYYAYYHRRPGCRAVNVSKAKLEGLLADETRAAAADAGTGLQLLAGNRDRK